MNGSRREIISLSEALQRVLTEVPPARSERVPLQQATGRVLAASIANRAPFPACDNSAMDGFGVRHRDLKGDRKGGGRLRLCGDSVAGQPLARPLGAGECARVMTGGLIPVGADTVVPVELTSGYTPLEDGCVEFRETPQEGANIRRTGSVRARGEVLIEPGTRISPSHVGVLAQQGVSRVSVGARPRVAVLPTGDEIVAIDADPGPGQVRDSNAWALLAQVGAAGGEGRLLPILRDREGDTTARLQEAFAAHDLVCTIGGVSMGTRDLLRQSFTDLGGRTIVASIRIKPGKPTLFGVAGDCRLLGLPGNPASSFTIFELLGAPWIRAFQGVPASRALVRRRARLSGAVPPNWRLQALPGRLVTGDDGIEVAAIEQKTSADLFSLGDADVLFFVPAEQAAATGDFVEWVELS